MKKEQKLSVTAIIFYVFAVLFLAYSAFMIFTAYDYVAGYVEQGTISYGKDFKDILSVYVQQAGPYLVYALLLYGVGYMIDLVTKMKGSMSFVVTETASQEKQDHKTAKLKDRETDEEDDEAFLASLKAESAKTVKQESKKEAKKDTAKKESTKKVEDKKEDTKKAEPKKETKPKTAKSKTKKTETAEKEVKADKTAEPVAETTAEKK